MTEDTNTPNYNEEDEIDLIALAKTLWEGRKFILKTLIVFAILGVAIALLSPKEYTASSTMVPQLSQSTSKLGGLSSLAAMAGFNLNMDNGGADLSPFIYPQIVQSVPFQLELMHTKFNVAEVDHPVTLYEYFSEYNSPGFLGQIKKYTIGLPFVVLKAIKGKSEALSPLPGGSDKTIQLTEEQEEVRKKLEECVTLEANDKDGYVVMKAVFSEPRLAAQVAQKAQELLQQSITEFKIEKANAQLQFIGERYNHKKKEFESAQAALAAFRDRNKNVTSALALTQEERLQSDYQLAFNVYSELAKQLEQAKIKVKEDTPVFAVIKPVTVPVDDNNSGLTTLLIWIFLGGVFSVGWIFGKQFLNTVKARWNEAT